MDLENFYHIQYELYEIYMELGDDLKNAKNKEELLPLYKELYGKATFSELDEFERKIIHDDYRFIITLAISSEYKYLSEKMELTEQMNESMKFESYTQASDFIEKNNIKNEFSRYILNINRVYMPKTDKHI